MYEYEDEELERLKMQKLRRILEEEERKKRVEAAKQAAKAEAIKKALMLRYVTPDVRGRIANIRLANPELATQIENYIIALIQSRRVDKVDFELFKRVVESITGRRQ